MVAGVLGLLRPFLRPSAATEFASALANAGAAENVIKNIRDGGGSAIAVQSDVGSEADVMRLFRHC